MADLVAKLIHILKEGVCVFFVLVFFFCSETHSIEHPNVNNKKGDSIVTKKSTLYTQLLAGEMLKTLVCALCCALGFGWLLVFRPCSSS